MEKYIKINTTLNYNGGFSSNESVLRVTNYSVTENFPLVTGLTAPMQTTTSGKTVNVNYQIYKSLGDFEAGQTPVQPLNFPYQINKAYNNEDVYNLVKTDLTSKSYDVEVLTGGTA
jgi:hypothetical protein